MQRRMRKLAHFLSHSLLQKYEKKNEQRKWFLISLSIFLFIIFLAPDFSADSFCILLNNRMNKM